MTTTENLIEWINQAAGIPPRQMRLSNLTGPKPAMAGLPLQALALKRAAAYLEGFNIIVKYHPQLSNPVRSQLQEQMEDKYAQLEEEMHALSVKQPLSKKDLATIKALRKNFYGALAKTLAQATGKSLGTVDNWLADAEHLGNWKPQLTQCTASQSGENTLVQMTTPVYFFTEDLANEFRHIHFLSPHKPAWFTSLPLWEQAALQAKITQAINQPGANFVLQNDQATRNAFAAALGTLPSTMRRMPGLANYYNESILIFNKAGEVVLQNSQFRAATPVPVKIKDTEERQRVTELNVRQAAAAAPHPSHDFLMTGYVSPAKPQEADVVKSLTHTTQTLNTNEPHLLYKNQPVNVLRYLSRQPIEKNAITSAVMEAGLNRLEALMAALPLSTRDGHTLRKAIEHWNITGDLQPLRQAIHSLRNVDTDENLARYQASLKISDADFCKDPMVGYATLSKKAATPAERQQAFTILLLMDALLHYAEMLQKQPSINESANPGLALICLEKILMGENTIGGCWSGKDRNGIMLIYWAAYLALFAKNGCLPSYFDTGDRHDELINTVAHFFLQNHQSVIAEQNAAGVCALKALKNILSAELVAAIIAQSGIPTHDNSATIIQQHAVISNSNRESSPASAKIAIGMRSLTSASMRPQTDPTPMRKPTPTTLPKRNSAPLHSAKHITSPLLKASHEDFLQRAAQMEPKAAKAFVKDFFIHPADSGVLDQQIKKALKKQLVGEGVEDTEATKLIETTFSTKPSVLSPERLAAQDALIRSLKKGKPPVTDIYNKVRDSVTSSKHRGTRT